MTTSATTVELRDTVAYWTPRLVAVSPERSARRPAPGKWSPREIIGHLIDSASNNHQRFVRAALRDDLVCETYAQDAWVGVQRYQEAPWLALVQLWASFNAHLAWFIEGLPDEVLTRPRLRHNLADVAFQDPPAGAPATLGWFFADYVAHLQHHMAQVEAALEGPAGG